MLKDASSQFYALAYLAMFLIPICDARPLRAALPPWVAVISAGGIAAMLCFLVLNTYPFVDVRSPSLFAAKILGTLLVVNAGGYMFYRSRGGKKTDHPSPALTVCKVCALSDLDNISVRVADIAARLAVLRDRLRDELRSSTFP